jgi:inner membrane protein YidH
MIDNFRDHAANERTYLAWIRTAITLMAFGFVIEKFDLFVRYLTIGGQLAALPAPGHRAQGAGMALLVVGLLIVGLATWGFLTNRRLIDAPERSVYRATLPNVALGVVVAALGVFLVVYLGRELFS